MPAKISGGGWKFQSFCGGWNKWEAQATEMFYKPMVTPVGYLIRLSHWKDDPEDAALVEVTSIEDDRYEAEGPTEVLEPAD